MRELLADLDAMQGRGPVGRAVVTSVWGSAPRGAGATLLAGADGTTAGSVSGGCVEQAAAEEIRAALTRGTPRLVTWGVTDETAWSVGLACGGTISVLVEPGVAPEILAAARADRATAVVTVLEGPLLGQRLTVSADGTATGKLPLPAVTLEAIRTVAADALRRDATGTYHVTNGGNQLGLLVECFAPAPTLVIFGGVHIAQALVPMARAAGFRTVVADARPGLVDASRFPDADQRIVGWPTEVFAATGLDASTYVCLLSHDPKFDEPAVELALRSPCAYLGVIGSARTQARRRERLRAAGFGDADLARLHGPIGLDLGGREPAEVAVAILAEMVGVRRGRGARATAGAGVSPAS
jgi:xanthine dehydrogenase accessory factor